MKKFNFYGDNRKFSQLPPQKPKHFLQEVSVINETDESTGNQIHKVLLDHRVLKTQGGQVLKVRECLVAAAFILKKIYTKSGKS